MKYLNEAPHTNTQSVSHHDTKVAQPYRQNTKKMRIQQHLRQWLKWAIFIVGMAGVQSTASAALMFEGSTTVSVTNPCDTTGETQVTEITIPALSLTPNDYIRAAGYSETTFYMEISTEGDYTYDFDNCDYAVLLSDSSGTPTSESSQDGDHGIFNWHTYGQQYLSSGSNIIPLYMQYTPTDVSTYVPGADSATVTIYLVVESYPLAAGS